ncbi:hypothetical protein CK203_019663 [Vitis vinifera]|uniref:Retrotransposon gag domain-containing protein n=1 Tax=Vitis vinifera TaxID=29760 RepID=A0A438JQK4_VITVI|nr:hypothetical protein CK203_019663 [Vitis vinifera]
MVINFVDYSLNQGAPTGHESVETPIGHESNGAVAGKDIDTSCVCQSGYETGGRLVKCDTPQRKEFEINEGPHASTSYECTIMYSAPYRQLVIRPYLVPLLPTFHGMESENPYAHIKEFEDVCNTFQEGGASIDLMRLKLFPFTLKDKAKIWLNSLRPRSIRSWTDLQAEFLKKFFPTHRTNGLKRQISNFSAKENEKFYECWKRYMEAINACLTMALILGYWRSGKDEVSVECLQCKGWMYTLKEDDDMKAKLAAMTRRLEELELKRIHEVQAVAEAPVQVKLCPNCQSYEHLVEECPTISAEREIATQYQQPDPPSQQSSSLEQAMANLSKVMGDFIEKQEATNARVDQRIDRVEIFNFKAYKFEYTARKGRFPSQLTKIPKVSMKWKAKRENHHR